MVLETEVHNVGAIAFYGRLGFVRDKRLHRYYLNGTDAFRLKLWLRDNGTRERLLAELQKYCVRGEQEVDLVVSYFRQATILIGDASSSYLLRFQDAFAQSLFIVSYLPEAFLLDLKQAYPSLWERIRQAQLERQEQLKQFYEQGIALGIFHPLQPALVVLQNELLLRMLIDPISPAEQNSTLNVLLWGCYELQKYQWLPPEVFAQVDDAPIKEFIEKMAGKISSNGKQILYMH